MELLSLEFWQRIALEYGILALALNSFVEAIFFPVPPDVLLITLCLANPQNSYEYALTATLFSSLGGIGGYYLGYFGGKPLAVKFFGKEKVKRVHSLYDNYESLIILLAGFTPLPYKLFTITSGVLYASLKKLFLFSIFGRGARFFLEAVLIEKFGQEAVNSIYKNLNLSTLILGIVILLTFTAYKLFKRNGNEQKKVF